MAKNMQPIAKRCKALGISPTVMGYSKKETKRNPGGQMRKKKSEYAIQLNEKQKVKFVYGILEKQFRMYYEKASAMSGKTGETALTLTADDAHAWAEYYEDGVGWIPFETATPYLNVMAESDWRWFQPDENADLTGAQAQEGDGSRNDTVRHSTVETVDQPNDEPQVITIWKELSSTLRSSLSRLHVGRWLLLLLALALLAAGCTLHMRLRNRFIDQL